MVSKLCTFSFISSSKLTSFEEHREALNHDHPQSAQATHSLWPQVSKTEREKKIIV
jgi:hypothetical protein